VVDARRAPRVPLRLAVTLRHGGDAWAVETEDVGPRGCQLVSARVLAPGSAVVLAVSCPAIDRAIAATGRVTWTRPDAPIRLGISFEVPTSQRGWFEALLAADPRAARAAERTPHRLAGDTPLRLGDPPTAVLDFSDDERAVLAAIGEGLTAAELADALAPRFHRARGALFSLIARRLVHLHAGPAGAAERWRPVLGPGPSVSPRRPMPRPHDAQRLHDEAMAHLGAGRGQLAVARLREALNLSPGDEMITAMLARLERWV
jgi:hypothetical protein